MLLTYMQNYPFIPDAEDISTTATVVDFICTSNACANKKNNGSMFGNILYLMLYPKYIFGKYMALLLHTRLWLLYCCLRH